MAVSETPTTGGQPTPDAPEVSIVIPVFNRLAFTRQCLDRLYRHTAGSYEVIVVDNGSTDGTEAFCRDLLARRPGLRYHRNPENLGFGPACNVGARLARGPDLLFLNNDTMVTPGWLAAMLETLRADPRVGIVGIQQRFPYTRRIHHTGIIFTAGGVPQHLYPDADAALPHVNRQRDYQAVTGSCLLIPRDLFFEVGGFDEGYRNGYEDVDLCFAVRARGYRVVCCTRAFIYHYGQITEGRTADDNRNAARFRARWGPSVRVDEADYARQDADDLRRAAALAATGPRPARRPGQRPVCFVDDLARPSALTWALADLALALARLGVPVRIPAGPLTDTLPRDARRALERLMAPRPEPDGIQVRWSHYWPQHLGRDLSGVLNLELFVVNYRFAEPGRDPWDVWLQGVRQNHYHKLPLTGFCRDVLLQVGVAPEDCDVFPLGYSPEVHTVAPPRRPDGRFRFLTVTNSHDLERYGTRLLLDTYWDAFRPEEDVVLVVKDYGAASGDTTLRDLIRARTGRARVEYRPEFLPKAELIRLYRGSDAFVSAHRGEGFGMKILDALACGLPVIIPLFGGPTEFCTQDNVLPVAFRLVPMGDCLDRRSLRIGNEPLWAEPDREDLARQLRRAYERRDEVRALGERGRSAVLGRFSWEAAARRLLAVIERLEQRFAQRPAARPGPPPAPPGRVAPPGRKSGTPGEPGRAVTACDRGPAPRAGSGPAPRVPGPDLEAGGDGVETPCGDPAGGRIPVPVPYREVLVDPPAPPSPYWLGCRVSVVIPTHNRRTLLARCLDALARQSILPEEFEVVVVDDGSTDGTAEWLESRRYPFPLRSLRQANQGPGAARNAGVEHARGELVLFLGDDIIAHEHLLEEHLLAHAEHPEPEAAVLGHVDWPPWLRVSPVMRYVCGEDTRQFAYHYIPHLPRLDFRFFYTSNVSLKRRFLLEAFAAGIRFDPCFRHAALEDTELAYRLQARGLTLHYRSGALAYHDHPMDLEGFARREERVGEMAVVFYRKHPRIDDLLQVRWVDDWVGPADRLAAEPDLLKRVRDLDRQTDEALRALAHALEGQVELDTASLTGPGADPGVGTPARSGPWARPGESAQATLGALYRVIFDVARTRGKVREWYTGVADREKVEAAGALLACVQKLEFLTAHDPTLRDVAPLRVPAPGAGLHDLEARLGGFPRQPTAPLPDPGSLRGHLRPLLLSGSLGVSLRLADLAIQRRVAAWTGPRGLAAYQRLRSVLKRRLVG